MIDLNLLENDTIVDLPPINFDDSDISGEDEYPVNYDVFDATNIPVNDGTNSDRSSSLIIWDTVHQQQDSTVRSNKTNINLQPPTPLAHLKKRSLGHWFEEHGVKL
jgi:hypothetical protein